MNRTTGIVIASVAAVPLVLLASFDPVGPPPEITTFLAEKHAPTDAVRLSWNDGTAHFIIVRSETPDFSASTTIEYVSRDGTSPLDDEGILSDGKTYYYQALDSNCVPSVLALSSSYPLIGDTLTIDGAGFDATDTRVYLEGTGIPITSATSSQLSLAVPAMAASGEITIISPTGVSEARKLDKLYLTGRNDLTHVCVDNVRAGCTHDVWVAERGASDRLHKINQLTGAVTSYTSWNEPVGLPQDSAGNMYYGNSTSSSTNQGTVWRLTQSGGSSTWAVAGSSGSDPVYSRAMAINPSNNNPSTLTVYVLDGNNIDHASSVRAVTPSIKSTYFTIGGTIPNPGGLAINGYQHMFFTRTTSIEEIDELRSFVFSYDSAFGITTVRLFAD